MKNGIAYPLAPEVIKIIEEKRKEYSKMIGVRVSQSKFTSIIASKLRPTIKGIKLCPRKIKQRRMRKWK